MTCGVWNRQWMKHFVEVQMDSYENGSGWFFLNFKAEILLIGFICWVKEWRIPKDHSRRI
jgi:hypothetical protein